MIAGKDPLKMNATITRRRLLQTLPALSVAQSWAARINWSATDTDLVYLAVSGSSPGVYRATWAPQTGHLGDPVLAAEIKAASFLAFAKRGALRLLFAVSEANGPNAQVHSFRVQPDGGLEHVSTQPTLGNGPTHLDASPDGRAIVVANYGGGSTTSFRVLPDGTLSDPVSHFTYAEGTAHAKASHAHSARFTPDGKHLLVNDLGLNAIYIYRADTTTADLHPIGTWHGRPGSGPRHLALHPNGKWMYSVNELDSTVDVLRWDNAHGTLTSVAHVSTLPADFPPGKAFAGEIGISPDGKSLYVGNRVANDTVAVFSLEDQGKTLRLLQFASHGGRNTRHLTCDPRGKWLVLSNIGSGEIVILPRLPGGTLSDAIQRTPLPGVMFVGFPSR